MNPIDLFQIDDQVIAEHNLQGAPSTYPCIVRKIKKGLLALEFTDHEQLTQETFTEHSHVTLKVFKNGKFSVISATLLSLKTFPIIVFKPENLMESGTDSMEDVFEEQESAIEPALMNKPSQRESARVNDRFELKFLTLTKEEAEEQKNRFFSKSTLHRKEALVPESSISFLMEKSKNCISSISYMDPALVAVIEDIYDRLNSLSLSLAVEEHEAVPENSLPDQEEKTDSGICVDLSGTGFRMITPKMLSQGDLIKVTIAPPRAAYTFCITALGMVMRVSELQKEGKPIRYSVGIKFEAIHDDDMEKITRYSFQLQQELLRVRGAKGGDT